MDRLIGPLGEKPERFTPKRLTLQPRTDTFVGEFTFAGTKLKIFQRKDATLYAKVPSGNMPIRLCADGKVIVGNAPPTDISPSLKEALGRT